MINVDTKLHREDCDCKAVIISGIKLRILEVKAVIIMDTMLQIEHCDNYRYNITLGLAPAPTLKCGLHRHRTGTDFCTVFSEKPRNLRAAAAARAKKKALPPMAEPRSCQEMQQQNWQEVSGRVTGAAPRAAAQRRPFNMQREQGDLL